jgi:L-alanine-DL-glutamate epimerase-like enolase superfamily enzyme
MVVRRVDAFPLIAAEPHYRGALRCITLARIESDDGTVGWGEAISQMRESTLATKTLIDEGFAPLVVGEDPVNVEAIWRQLCRHAYWYRGWRASPRSRSARSTWRCGT